MCRFEHMVSRAEPQLLTESLSVFAPGEEYDSRVGGHDGLEDALGESIPAEGSMRIGLALLDG
jgi:hypothetical protein